MKIKFPLAISIIILLGGCSANNNDEEFDKNTVEKAKATVESYLKSNFNDIDTITFEDDYTHPMGGMNVRGTVNGGGSFL